ncbi:hypothetical protein [Streptomyces nigrescens]|uniref:hypothetical protein n=1 Tax=Streptomyces nigrescens TaxID=1920 RepID=UPI0036F6B2AC
MRLISAPAEQATGKLWEGTKAAATAFAGVRKPALYGIHDGTERDGIAYRAELTAFIDSPACAPEPVLTGELELPETWWKSLHTDLETIAACWISRGSGWHRSATTPLCCTSTPSSPRRPPPASVPNSRSWTALPATPHYWSSQQTFSNPPPAATTLSTIKFFPMSGGLSVM